MQFTLALAIGVMWTGVLSAEVVEAPKLQRHAPAQWPSELIGTDIEGRVALELVIDETGVVKDAFVRESNNPLSDRAALNAALKWKFRPGKIDGKIAAMRIVHTVEFVAPKGGQPLWRIFQSRYGAAGTEEAAPSLPRPINTQFPLYPLAAALAYRTGYVSAVLSIDERGEVEEVKITQSSDDELAGSVRASLETWTFSPARRTDGTPVKTTLSIGYDFAPPGQNATLPMSEGAKNFLLLLRQPGRPAIVPFSKLDVRPRPLSQRPPIYPLALRKRGIAGRAEIELFIDRDGDVQFPTVVSATDPAFGYAAAQAVAAWRFTEPRMRGERVATVVRVPINFTPPK